MSRLAHLLLEGTDPKFGGHRWLDDVPHIPKVSFWKGRPIDRARLPPTLDCTLQPLNPRSADDGPHLPAFFRGSVPLFHDDLLAALREAGVDNLEEFPARLIDPDGPVHTDYKAVNVLGLVAAADLAKSTATVHGEPLIDVEFDRLVLDPAKAGELKLFRMAENVSAILVREDVVAHLRRRGFERLWFLRLDQAAI